MLRAKPEIQTREGYGYADQALRFGGRSTAG